jgi:hypothetical protein
MTKRNNPRPEDVTPKVVASWMLAKLESDRQIDQAYIASDILDRFGEGFIYYTGSGNIAISKDVLAEFRKLTGDEVIWDRRWKTWRFREPGDDPGRMQR